MASANQTNKTRYSLLPRTSVDSNLGNVIEEDTPLVAQNRTSVPTHQPGSRCWKITYKAAWTPFVLQGFAFIFAIITLTIESIRLVQAVKWGRWRYQTGNRQFIAPIIAFLSFDILIFLIVILYFILSRYFHIALKSTKNSSIHARGPQALSSQQISDTPRPAITAAYLLETFIIVSLVVGMGIEGGCTGKIPLQALSQIFGWCTIFFHVISVIKFILPSKKIYTLSLSSSEAADGTTWSASPIDPGRSYRDLEERWEQVEDGGAQPKPVVREQTKDMI